MATTTPPADQTLELQVFGRPLQAEDWLKDIRLRSSLLFMPLPANELSRLLANRVAKRATWAIPHGDRLIKSLEDRTDAFLTEIGRIRDAIEASAYVETASGTTLADAYLDDIDCEVREILDERTRLAAEWNQLRPNEPARANDRVSQVQKYFEQAMNERGADRGLLLREARSSLIEIGNSQPVQHPILWLAQGWATWQLTENYSEAMAILVRVDHHPIPSIALSTAYRLLAHFSQLDENPAKALEYALKAVQIRESAEGCLDAGLFCSTLHDPQNAKAHFEKAFVLRPGTFIAALSDEQSLTAGTELLEVAVRVQLRLRREGRKAITSWATAAREVLEAQRACPGGLHIPHELMEGHKQVAQRFEDCDLIVGGYLTRTSRESAIDVFDCAKKSLQSEYVKRCDAVSMARKSIEHAGNWRDNRIKSAKKDQEEINRRAQEMLTKFDAEADKAEKGSLFGFAGGCALFALYLISFLILADRGIPIGITTPVGMVATIVSGIPILIAIGLQVGHGLKRMSIENKVQETMRRSKVAGEHASADADDEYREQIKHHRKTLAAADAELKRVESAMRCLGVKQAVNTEPIPEIAEEDPSLDEEDGAEDEFDIELEEPAA